ncbi:MAG TPA: DUF2062 domain-containing protein [Opitutaceae bacterium]|nr:DUF2062 domain-containing protein [Opitutaceae bacterium]
MSVNDPVIASSSATAPRNVWQRRIVDPVVAQLTQGLIPHKIALTIAIGSAIAMFPILGTTTLFCLLIGIVMKLNQPIIQGVNYVCTPLHLTFIFYAFRWGESVFGHEHTRLQFRSMMRLLHQHPIDFVATYSLTAFHAILIWAILVPFWATAVYYVTLPIIRGIDRVRLEAAAKAAAEKARNHPVP